MAEQREHVVFTAELLGEKGVQPLPLGGVQHVGITRGIRDVQRFRHGESQVLVAHGIRLDKNGAQLLVGRLFLRVKRLL